tara:strand:+ start:373 stop:798 length:426 start_codon:yes stop_codon:yes gene_type:complete
MGSRLTQRGRKNGIVYSVACNVEADAYGTRLYISTSVQKKEHVETLVSYTRDLPTEDDVRNTQKWIHAQRKLAVATSPMAVAYEVVDFLRFRRDLIMDGGYDWESESSKYNGVTYAQVIAFWKTYLVDGPFYRTIVGNVNN